MATPTVIGRGTSVRGRVSGNGDLEIGGFVDGDVAVSGEVLVEATGLVGAGITARRIVVRGAVRGDLVAEEAVILEATARVVGDLRAPRVAIAQGGLVRGHVQTGAAGAARPRTAQASAAATRPAAAASSAGSSRDRDERREAPPRAAAKAAPPPPPPAPAKRQEPARAAERSNGSATPHRGATLAGTRVGPPPPVVPVLKKGTKAVQKKR